MASDWVIPVIILLATSAGTIPVHAALYFLARIIVKRTPNQVDDDLVLYLRWPTMALFPLIGLLVTLPFQSYMSDGVIGAIRHAVIILLIAAATWVLINLVRVSSRVATRQARETREKDPLGYRRVETQVVVICRLAYTVIVLFAIAGVLMTFPAAWSYGVSILASAGVAGLIVTLAARPGLENMIASLTIALSQPITLEDEVLVDGEHGYIEEITAQFVVIRTIDERRLVYPLTRFTGSPFQNWTRTKLEKMAMVTLTLGLNTDLDKLRERLISVLQDCTDWDRRSSHLQVSGFEEEKMQVRIIASTANGTAKARLECAIREKLLPFLVSPPTISRGSSRTDVVQMSGPFEKLGWGDGTTDLASMAWPPDPIRRRPASILKNPAV
ncbi:Mechanosensitive ion channel-domain-containing protein [Piptocephalis cylindrospora]|uniref:Mechanosensitive ion channel-domain-containing protein n=1 Tax=Piptocephalis cylindrospora TaxID=1907219 RepID=A0A4P9Y475_9FUNG|nr:Mechanosensitive ion channel-domain-containing protein [Piptocephalis cylindrospora]|eukprot:RKP13766.1 Mechanosensitive ion channel-domain-containing protein [Piptocephalis cylindrospora]